MEKDLLQILQHSLGLDRHGRGRQYRNHFCPGGEDINKCRELVNLGFMTERPASEITGGILFTVTQKGIEAVLTRAPDQG